MTARSHTRKARKLRRRANRRKIALQRRLERQRGGQHR